MKPIDILKTAWQNLTRRKLRTILTTLGVIVGIVTIVAMVSLGIGVKKEVMNSFEALGGLSTVTVKPQTEEESLFTPYGRPRRTEILTPAVVEEFSQLDEVKLVFPRVNLPRTMNITLEIDDTEISRLWIDDAVPATLAPEPFEQPPKIIAGRDIAYTEQGVVVISQSLLDDTTYADNAAAIIGRPVTFNLYAPRGETRSFTATIVGLLDRDTRVRMPLADQQAMKEWWYNDPDLLVNEGYDSVQLETASLQIAIQVAEEIERRGFEVETAQEILNAINKAFIVLETMLGSVGGLALFVASVGIANTMVMAIYERTREIGILKAIGASPGDIRVLFMVEASLIGCTGGIVGLIGGWAVGRVANRVMLWYLNTQNIPARGNFFVISWWLALGALAFATLVGLIAGLYPAARAARLDPLDALRYE